MISRTIVTVIAATLLSVSLASASSAQDHHRSVPNGIEVITIIGKRPVPAVAAACLVRMTAGTDAAAERTNRSGNFSKGVLESSRAITGEHLHAAKRCSDQAALRLDPPEAAFKPS